MPTAPSDPPDETSPLAPASELMVGDAFGRVRYADPSPPLQRRDARERALRTLQRFISLLVFSREGDVPGGEPVRFRIPEDRIHVYQPDDVRQRSQQGSSLGILPGRARHEAYGLGPSEVLEDTADQFGDGLVLVRRSDHVELVGIEVFTAKHPERQGVVAGLKEVFGMDDRSGALLLTCDDYFDQVASFRLDESEPIDDPDGTLNRRRAHLYVLLQVPEVALVRYRGMTVLPEVVAEKGLDLDE